MSKFTYSENGQFEYNPHGWNPYPYFLPREEGVYRVLHSDVHGDVYEDVLYYNPRYESFLCQVEPDVNILAFKKSEYDGIDLKKFKKLFEG